MIENLPEDKLEALIERVVSKSHMAIAKVQSNGLGDVYKRLGAIEMAQATQTEILHGILKAQDETTITNKERNGRIGKLEEKATLANGWIKGLGIGMGIILMLAGIIFELRLGKVSDVAEDTQGMLIAHIQKENAQESTNK